MEIDPRFASFSRRGSYIVFSRGKRFGTAQGASANPDDDLWMRNVTRDAEMPVFRVEILKDGVPQAFSAIADPSRLKLETAHGAAEICIDEDAVVRVRASGVGLRFTAAPESYNAAFPWPPNRAWVNVSGPEKQYMFSPIAGSLRLDAPWVNAKCTNIAVDLVPDGNGTVEAAIEEFEGSWEPRAYTKPWDECVSDAAADYQRFRSALPAVPPAYEDAARLAAYIDWACLVNPHGFITRPSILVSINGFARVWSWDHCFILLPFLEKDPKLAWDQFMVVFENQDDKGQLPDCISGRRRLMNFTKPPVHGWALRRMMRMTDFIDKERLGEAYGPMCRWTDWWFKYRNPDGDGLPQYHHGNDSGWDNATAFEVGLPVKGADLAAYLTVQMDVLSDMAGRLGKPFEARAWKGGADELLARMMEKLWRGDRFVSPRAYDGAVAEGSQSLLNLMPIVLGKRLSKNVAACLVAGIRRHLTAYGLATEHPDSPFYDDAGYWRGPLWAPSTMLVVDGLMEIGEKELAAEIAKRFCDTAKAGAMSENFGAVTGDPRSDRAFAWTSSVFLVLANEFLR
jgi:putative isomerase